MAQWGHQVDGWGVEGFIEHNGAAVVANEVEEQALAVGKGCRLVHIEGSEGGGATFHRTEAEVGLEHGRQRGHGHALAQIEAGVGMLIVAACGAVATIVGVLLQAIDAVVRRHGGGVAHQASGALVVLLGQQHLLAPVAHDVAHEGGTGADGGMGGPVALLRELGQTVAQHLAHHEVGAPAAAAGRVEPFAQQVAVPPATLEHRATARLPGLLALAGPHIIIHIAQHLIALVAGVHVETGAAAHVVDRGQIPLLHALGSAGVVDELPQQGGLLYGIDLQPRTVGVDVAQDVAVAVTDAGRRKPPVLGVHRVAALNHLVGAVAIHVGHAQLVKLCGPGALVVAAPGAVVVPVGGLLQIPSNGGPVVFPCEDVVVMRLVLVAIQAFHH